MPEVGHFGSLDFLVWVVGQGVEVAALLVEDFLWLARMLFGSLGLEVASLQGRDCNRMLVLVGMVD